MDIIEDYNRRNTGPGITFPTISTKLERQVDLYFRQKSVSTSTGALLVIAAFDHFHRVKPA